MSYVLNNADSFQGSNCYPMHLAASRPDCVEIEKLPTVEWVVDLLHPHMLALSREEIERRLTIVTVDNSILRDAGLNIQDTIVAHGNGFNITWRKQK